MLVKTAGVKHMVVLINKMDDPTVGWDKARWEHIISPFYIFAFRMEDQGIQRCMSFTEKIVVGQISGKVMHSGKVMYMSFTENSFKAMQ